MALSRYTISFLVRKPGGTYTFGPHDGGTAIASDYEGALEIIKKQVESEGWEVERPLSISETPLLEGKDGTN